MLDPEAELAKAQVLRSGKSCVAETMHGAAQTLHHQQLLLPAVCTALNATPTTSCIPPHLHPEPARNPHADPALPPNLCRWEADGRAMMGAGPRLGEGWGG